MARYTYGGRTTDFSINDPATTGGALTAAISQTGGTVWTAKTGGSQITDLLVAGSPTATISTDSHGFIVPFQGPDGYNSAAWVTFGGTRVLLDPQGPFALQADAVPLSTATPQKASTSGSAGTALSATRGDHSHPLLQHLGAPVFGSGSVLSGGGLFAYHNPLGGTNGIGTVVDAKGPITPLPIYRRQTIKELNVKVGTAGDASAQIAFAIWAVNTNGAPLGDPISTSAFIAATSTGIKTFGSLSITLDPGLYYMVMNSKGFTSTRPRCYVADRSNIYGLWLPSSAAGAGGSDALPALTLTTVNETSGAFPTGVAVGDFSYGNNNPSAWWYAYTADPA